MRLRAIGAMFVMLAVAATATWGQDGSIELHPMGVDPNTGAATEAYLDSCEAVPTPVFGGAGQKVILGVYGRLAGATLDGIGGAQMYVDGLEGLPSGWTITVTYPANTLQAYTASALVAPRTVNSALNRGQVSTWLDVTGYDAPNCQKDAYVKLAQIDLLQLGAPVALPNDHFVTVVATDPQIGPLDCPVMTACDFPVFTAYCATGANLIINPVDFHCPQVAVTNTSWGALKSLYR